MISDADAIDILIDELTENAESNDIEARKWAIKIAIKAIEAKGKILTAIKEIKDIDILTEVIENAYN